VRATLIVNPHAGHGLATRVAGTVASTLRAVVPELVATVTADEAATSRVAAQAAQRGDDVLAVLGGDGTAHLAAQAVAGTATALAVLPTGSGNDFATALGIPADPVQAAQHIAQALQTGQRRRTVLCTGFDAAVNKRANAMRWPSGPRRYDLAVWAELATLTPRPVRVRTETTEVAMEAILVAVGNGSSYGGGLRICPDATLADGLLDVIIIAAVSRRRLLRVFPALRTGGHLHEPEVTVLKATTVSIDGDPGWPVYADGEPQGTLPVTVHCEPGALTVVA
jgi:diacylglycerol kinase (ATP)